MHGIATALPPLYIACRNGRSNIARLLLEAGADVDARSNDRMNTPLHRVSAYGGSDLLGLLIQFGADVDAKDRSENTPLHWACERGNMETIRLLMDHGADPTIQNVRKKTPAEMMDNRVAEANEIREILKMPREELGYCAPGM